MKSRKVLLAIIMAAVLMTGCSNVTQTQTASTISGTELATLKTSEEASEELFSSRDMEVGYDESECVKISLKGTSGSCDSDTVNIADGTITITEEGTYILSGTMTEGMIIVDAEDSDKVQLVLDNANITCATSAAIYVKNADKVFITTAADSENTLTNGGEYEAIDDNNIDGVIFSKADLTLNGQGTLNIKANAGHGIVSKDDLVLTSGTYQINAEKHGLQGKDCLSIADGTYTIECGEDGLHTGGNLDIVNGTFQIKSGDDGMHADAALTIYNGKIDITESYEGIEGKTIDIIDGDISVVSSDDGLNATSGSTDTADASGNKTVGSTDAADASGNATVGSTDAADASGNKTSMEGQKPADGQTPPEMPEGVDGQTPPTTPEGADGQTPPTTPEGIDGQTQPMTPEGADGQTQPEKPEGVDGDSGNGGPGNGDNPMGNGGAPGQAEEGVYLRIAGGTLHVNASGDGLDSNGNLYITGGEVYVSGPTNDGNSAIDYDGNASITGGILVAAGSSGMAQNLGEDSTQGVMMTGVDSGEAGSTITLEDSEGNELVSWQPDKVYTCVIISTPEMEKGGTYTLKTGDAEKVVTMESLVYSDGVAGGPR